MAQAHLQTIAQCMENITKLSRTILKFTNVQTGRLWKRRPVW